MPRHYKVLKAEIEAGHTVRLRDGRVIGRVEDLPKPQTGDLRGTKLTEAESAHLLDEVDRLKRENERLRSGSAPALQSGEGGPLDPPSDPVETAPGSDQAGAEESAGPQGHRDRRRGR